MDEQVSALARLEPNLTCAFEPLKAELCCSCSAWAAGAVGGGKWRSWPWGVSLKKFFKPSYNSPCFPPCEAFSAGDTRLSKDLLVMGADKCDCSCL